MKVALDCDVSDAADAHRSLGAWIDAVESGELAADDLIHQINGIIDALDTVRSNVRRALGW